MRYHIGVFNLINLIWFIVINLISYIIVSWHYNNFMLPLDAFFYPSVFLLLNIFSPTHVYLTMLAIIFLALCYWLGLYITDMSGEKIICFFTLLAILFTFGDIDSINHIIIEPANLKNILIQRDIWIGLWVGGIFNFIVAATNND